MYHCWSPLETQSDHAESDVTFTYSGPCRVAREVVYCRVVGVTENQESQSLKVPGPLLSSLSVSAIQVPSTT
jgi:hypothetical protein